jgi:hypothetical protein
MNEVILKADRRGHLRYTLEQKQALTPAKWLAARSLKSAPPEGRCKHHQKLAPIEKVTCRPR